MEKFYGCDRPLNDDQRRVLDDNRNKLTQMIDPLRIVDRLYENRCFNWLHKDHIESGLNTLDKVDRLLDIVRRRSFADLMKLVDVLHASGHPLLARLLREGGGKSTRYYQFHKIHVFVICSLYIFVSFYAVGYYSIAYHFELTATVF